MTADTSQSNSYTRTPNWAYDLMAVVTPAQFKVIAAGVRLTYGWHQEWTDASAQTVAEMTGINRSTVAEILNFFTAVGLTERTAGERNGYRWRLVPMSPADLSAKATAHLSAKATGDDMTCRLRQQVVVGSGDNYLSAKATTNKEERKSLKKGKERERAAPAAPAPEATAESRPSNGEPAQTATTQSAARHPNPPVPPAPPSPAPAGDFAQSRLVETADVDPVAVYREVTKVTKPNEAQRKAIRERVTGDVDLWRAACERFARNGWNVRAVDNLLDAYGKAVAERRREEAAQRENEERRRQREADNRPLSAEERAQYQQRFAELASQLAAKAAEADAHSYLYGGRGRRQARAS